MCQEFLHFSLPIIQIHTPGLPTLLLLPAHLPPTSILVHKLPTAPPQMPLGHLTLQPAYQLLAGEGLNFLFAWVSGATTLSFYTRSFFLPQCNHEPLARVPATASPCVEEPPPTPVQGPIAEPGMATFLLPYCPLSRGTQFHLQVS